MQEMMGLPDYIDLPNQLEGIQFDGFDIHFESQLQNQPNAHPDMSKREVKNIKELKDLKMFMSGRD